MTINKSQGQTLQKVGIYLPQTVFAHGQLYVAFSRATSKAGVKVVIDDTADQGKLIKISPNLFTPNIVYRELLNSESISVPVQQHDRHEETPTENDQQIFSAGCTWYLISIEGDGNCMFRALSHQIEGHQHSYWQFRQEIVSYLRQNRTQYEAFISNDETETFEKYCDIMSKDGTYGTHRKLRIFEILYNASVIVHKENGSTTRISPDDIRQREINLYYTLPGNHENRAHYDSLI